MPYMSCVTVLTRVCLTRGVFDTRVCVCGTGADPQLKDMEEALKAVGIPPSAAQTVRP